MNKKTLRKQFGFKYSDKILFYVGRIEPEQGSDYLLELIKRNPEKKFILIGQMRDDNFKDKKFENVTYIPFVPNTELPYYYNLADITLFFSKRNAYPYPPRESLACEVPVILFNLNTFGQLKTDAVKKVPFDVEKIQKEIDNLFYLSKKVKEIMIKE
jgi:glycosyltransferase involved in cell wall biosynthesis